MESLKMDLPALAELLRSKGRGKDSVLAHITPKEAALLKKRGGRGSINPETGLLEFDEDTTPIEQAPVQTQEQPAPAPTEQPSASQDTTGGYGIKTGAPETPLFTGAPEAGTLVSQPYNPNLSATTQYGIQAAPPSITPPGLSPSQPFGTIAGTPTPTVDTGTTKQPPSFGDRLTNALTDPTNLARLGLTTGLGLFGASQARKAAQQGQAVQGQEQAIATPYQAQGQQLVGAAQRGELTPASQQAYNAAKAQLAQSQANRGGVGAQQAANQLASIYQTLLNNQYTYGLNVMQIGDNISLGAIKTGLQLDTQLNQATTNFYTTLAQMVGGGFTPYSGATTTPTRTVNG
jgi:hypothetical protein